ncbi:lantibiotic dehydratase [Kitasatospora sp. NBC_01266]|uniref:lantibiotic dehydratase n=1 Tax=Kitasatospora sp. NBC_01266 TaxID=2903572 RepID=UPI002E32BE30|nr:lantibiotic dehydratase [Kitasatospora sp. NBC_01266]
MADPGAPAPSVRWQAAPVVVLRQAGFPLSLLAPLLAGDLALAAREVTERQSSLGEQAARLREALSGTRLPGRDGVRNRLTGLRELTEQDLELLASLGAATGRDGAAYQRAVRDLALHTMEYRAAHQERLAAHRRVVADLFARDADLRQVLLVANSAKYEQFAGWLDAGVGTLDKRARMRTDLLTMYAQRVAAKCETHAHFGPLTVGRLADGAGVGWSGGHPRDARSWLNHWSVSRLAELAAAQPQLRPLIRPRRHPWAFPQPDGRIELWQAGAMREIELSEPDAWLWQRCDGDRTIGELRAAWRAQWPTDQDPVGCCEAALARLTEAGCLLTEFEVPAGDRAPLAALLHQLAGAPAGEAADLWERIADLGRGIRRFAAVTDTAERAEALSSVRHGFEELTQSSADRLNGQYYADRTIFRAHVLSGIRELTVGRNIADFLTGEFADVYAFALAGPRRRVTEETGILADWLRRRFGADVAVPLDRLYRAFAEDQDQLAAACAQVDRRIAALDAQLLRDLLADGDPGAHEVVVPPERMRQLLRGLPTAPAALLNPDVQFAAAGPQAMANGDFLAVTGDFHAVRELLTQTPYAGLIEECAPEVVPAVHEGLLSLLDEDEILVDLTRNQRAVRLLLPCLDLEVRDRSPKPPGQVLQPADLYVVLRDGRPELRALGRSGRLRLTSPPASALSLAEDPLVPFSFPRRSGGTMLAADGIDHLPRIRSGRAVLMRELWRIPARRWHGAASAPDPALEYVTAQALRAEYQLPRHVFARVPGQPKPIYVDWDAPLLVRQLFRLARQVTEPVTVTEMLPAPGQEWLREAGEGYVGELRCAVFGPRPDARPGREGQ